MSADRLRSKTATAGRGGGVSALPVVAESRAALRRLQEDLVGLSSEALDTQEREPRPVGGVASQSLLVESAKADLRRAELTTEIAEIVLREYQEGTFKADKAAADAELKRAKDELERAEPRIEQAKERSAKARASRAGDRALSAAKPSPEDITSGWYFETIEVVAQLAVKKARIELEQAEGRLKVLLEYEQPRE